MTKYLSSSTNDKCTVLEKKLSDMFSSVKTILSIETLEDNADDGLFLEEQVKRIDEIVAPSVFLDTILSKNILMIGLLHMRMVTF